MNLPNIMIIGLTGQSGAGKSTVCKAFAESGFTVIDCDKTARKTAENSRFLDELSQRFSEKLLNPDGSLNRAATARLIFTDEEKRGLYQRIIFPYIIYEIMREIRNAKGNVLLDAPTLFEAKLDMLCDKIVSVTADLDKCAERIIKRDKITLEQARERLSSQHSAEFFKERSDVNIENGGTLEELISSAKRLTEKLRTEADNEQIQT
ncbi:MAG: dephospho-CoA kinase [Ruminococcaceae bacterium]|nr:dephospho-CoA kinase [Oscillospiraceae bacterium]